MADKEATVYIVDLGKSMGKCENGREVTNLDFGMQYVWDKVCTTTAASRKTWLVGALGLGTEETKHCLEGEEGYDNISVLKKVDEMSMSSLRSLQNKIKTSDIEGGDAISAIIVATDMISNSAARKGLKYKRKIIVVTDGQGPIDADDLDEVANQINDLEIQLIILGIDFDDAEYGFKEEDKSDRKAENEKLLHKLVSKCEGGIIGTMAEAVDELDKPRLKPIRPYKTYDGLLTLGDPNLPEAAALSINVERYSTTKVKRPEAASTVVVKSKPGGGATQSTETLDEMDIDEGGMHFEGIKQIRNYTIKDPSKEVGFRDVAFEDLVKGYTYGRTAVYIEDVEKNVTQLETVKGFSILGFIPSERYERMLGMGETCMIVSRKHSEKDELTLSALIHTLYETESVAVARLVLKDMKGPQLLLLMPSIEPDFECLYDVPLPFAEDVRPYQFPPLDKVITITGSTLTKHRLLPTDELNQAMSDYVDAMDISEYNVDDDGNPAEFAPLEDSFSPMIHRVNHAIRERALHPDPENAYQPPTLAILERFSHPPSDLVEKKKPEIKALIAAAGVKKVAPKAKGRFKNDFVKPISNIDVRQFFPPGAAEITVENAVPAFKQRVEASTNDEVIAKAIDNMGNVARELIETSTGGSKYNQALENLRTMRTAMVEVELPKLYNDYLRSLKTDIVGEKLGGDRSVMWHKLISAGLGLITTSQSEASDVTDEAASKFSYPSS